MTDADKIDNLLAQRRELMDKIEEQIDERGRIIERLDALEEGIESARRHMYALNKAVADERDKTRSLQARIDAEALATALEATKQTAGQLLTLKEATGDMPADLAALFVSTAFRVADAALRAYREGTMSDALTSEQLGTTDVRTAAAQIGVDLRGEDGQPFHCEQRMTVKGGIVGTDYAKCETCGALLLRMDSPHVNGGYRFDEADYESLGDDVWKAIPALAGDKEEHGEA